MLFEYDPAKSARTRAKHGIDFEQAKRLWEDRVSWRWTLRTRMRLGTPS